MESNTVVTMSGMKTEVSSATKSSVATECFHCGQAVTDGGFADNEKSFCCAGCLSVYRILQSAQLGSYYEVDTKAGIRPTGHEPRRFDYLDDPSIAPRLLEYSDAARSRVTFLVPQIHCSACIWLLENLGRLEPTIRRSTVNFLARRVTIEFATGKVALSQIVSLLAKLGYEPDIKLDRIDPIPVKNPNTSLYVKVGIAGFSFANIMLFSFPEYLSSGQIGSDTISTFFRYANLLLSVPVLLYSASDYFKSAVAGLRQRTLNLDVPIALGLLALFFRSLYDVVSGSGPGYFDSFTGLVLFLLAGKLFQRKTYQWLSFDRDYRAYFPIAVRRIVSSGEETVAVGNVGVGDRIVIRNQELIPADGILMEGRASVDYSFVTGESDQHELKVGDRVYAGGRQVGGAIQIEVIKSVEESYLVSLWSNLRGDQSATRTVSEKVLSTVTAGIGKYFTLAVLCIAGLTAWWWIGHDSSRWVHAFTSVLLVACPCAIALSSPFVFGTGMRIFSGQKVFLRHPDVVDALSRIDTIVFDKTGTLTASLDGQAEFVGDPLNQQESELVAELARHSTHPLSRALVSLSIEAISIAVRDYQESPGHGIAGKVGDRQVKLGRRSYVTTDSDSDTANPELSENGRVYVSIDSVIRGYFILGSTVRDGLKEEVTKLGESYDLRVLTGDSAREKATLQELFGDRAVCEFNLLPHDKRDRIENLRRSGKRVLMLGDGLNDAGALGAADVGMAVTEDTSAFTPGCDGILHASNLSRLSKFLNAAKLSRRIVFASFAISIVYNVVGIGFAASGHLSPLVSAILMPVSSVSVVGFGTLATWLAARRKGLV